MPRRFLRFSLLSFLLLTALICVSVSHFRVTHEMLELRQQNEDFKEDLGYIKIDDPDKIYLRRLETLDPLTWRVRLYLPPKIKYRLCNRHSRGGGASGMSHPDDQFTITFGVRRADGGDGRWQMIYTLPGSAGSWTLDAESVQSLIESDSASVSLIRRETEEFNAGAEVELVRFGSNRVWIELDTSRRKMRR